MQIDPKLAPAPDGKQHPKQPSAEDKARLDAARKFEGILLQQLLHVMRSTAKSGGMASGDGASGQYLSMFDEVIAERLSEGGGIGLAAPLMEALGGDPELARQTLPSEARSTTSMGVTGGTSRASAVTPPLPSLSGATARLAKAAYAISAPEGGKQWAREGTLTERDLASNLETPAEGGVARFSVRAAQGYRDAYKCNLFALEAARRGGFQVPVVARAQGWGFPTSNTVTEDAADGSLRGDWAEVVPSARIAEVKDKVARGEMAIMLTGSGKDGRHGHMAVVERIHDVQLDAQGNVQRVEFDGYEARVDGAQHLERRVWTRAGHGEDSRRARNGFGTIELLALRPAESSQVPEIRLSSAVRASGPKTP